MIALFPVVFTSMMLILHPRIGGPPTAAVIANSGWGLIGFGVAIAVLHVAALRFGSAIALSLALATCVSWNLALWWIGRRRSCAECRHCGMRAKRPTMRHASIIRVRVADHIAPRMTAYVFGSFAFSAYSASSASRGDISSGCSAFSASISCSASLGGAGFGGRARRHREQRQIVGQRARGLAAVLRLEFGQHRFGARDHRPAAGRRASPPGCRRSGRPSPAALRAGTPRRPAIP